MAGDGDETSRGKSLYSIVIPATVSVIVAVVTALITVFTTERQLEVDRHDLVIQEQRHRLEHEQRLDALLAQWLPGVLNAEDNELRRNALGYLRTRLHAEERELVLKVLVDKENDAVVRVDLQAELEDARAELRGLVVGSSPPERSLTSPTQQHDGKSWSRRVGRRSSMTDGCSTSSTPGLTRGWMRRRGSRLCRRSSSRTHT